MDKAFHLCVFAHVFWHVMPWQISYHNKCMDKAFHPCVLAHVFWHLMTVRISYHNIKSLTPAADVYFTHRPDPPEEKSSNTYA